MRRLAALAALIALAGCAVPQPETAAEAVMAAPAKDACLPDDDGIGGTGCPVN